MSPWILLFLSSVQFCASSSLFCASFCFLLFLFLLPLTGLALLQYLTFFLHNMSDASLVADTSASAFPFRSPWRSRVIHPPGWRTWQNEIGPRRVRSGREPGVGERFYKGSQSRKTALQEVSVYTDRRQKLGAGACLKAVFFFQSDFNSNRAQTPGTESLQETPRQAKWEDSEQERRPRSGVLTYWEALRNPGGVRDVRRAHNAVTSETKTFSSECTRCSPEITSGSSGNCACSPGGAGPGPPRGGAIAFGWMEGGVYA